MAKRYELRSLQSKREESRQIYSPPPRSLPRVPLIKGGFSDALSSEEAEYMRIIRDKLSDSGDENVDEGTEASAKRYAMIAVDHYKKYGNFELVGAGLLVAGNIPGGRIFHLNYKAKNNDVPVAEVQTFFTEITKTKKDGVTIHCNISLGPSDSLPEKANTQGCLYCLSHNIHHHQSRMTFRNGGLLFWNTLRSEVCRLDNLMEKGMKKRNYSPKFKHPGIVYVGKEYDGKMDDFANAALRMFNLEQSTNLELLRIGSWEVVHLPIGFVYHLNFEAKRNNDPEALVHTFFAQVIDTFCYFFAHYCKCLGQSDSLPDEIDLHGCQYCIPADSSFSPSVRHPPGPGYLIGRETYPC